MNLYEMDAHALVCVGPIDAMLVDPPPDGAADVVRRFPDDAPARSVYVRAAPPRLRAMRRAGPTKGYQAEAAGIVNMFTHTAHVESIAVF